MSYYNEQGYRICTTHRFDEGEKDFKKIYQIQFRGLSKKVSGRPDWTTKEGENQ